MILEFIPWHEQYSVIVSLVTIRTKTWEERGKSWEGSEFSLVSLVF